MEPSNELVVSLPSEEPHRKMTKIIVQQVVFHQLPPESDPCLRQILFIYSSANEIWRTKDRAALAGDVGKIWPRGVVSSQRQYSCVLTGAVWETAAGGERGGKIRQKNKRGDFRQP